VERGIAEGLYIIRGEYPDLVASEIKNIVNTIRKLVVLSVCLNSREDIKEGELDQMIAQHRGKLLLEQHTNKELSALELLKAIECILVQVDLEIIDEVIGGNISTEDRFALSLLLNYKASLKDLIIECIPGYEDIPWEIE
jgi:hypothetical protein